MFSGAEHTGREGGSGCSLRWDRTEQEGRREASGGAQQRGDGGSRGKGDWAGSWPVGKANGKIGWWLRFAVKDDPGP